VLYVRGRGQSPPPAPASGTPQTSITDDIIAEIATLDEQFENGELSQKDYEKRRQILKERLTRQMDKGDPS